MLKSVFEHEFKEAGAAKLNGNCILFRKPLQIYNLASDETTYFESLDEAFDFKLEGGETIKETIDAADVGSMFTLHLDGGRGSGSDAWSGRFSHAGGGGEGGIGKDDFPARMNNKIKVKNQQEALKQFRNVHANDDKESAVSVDENGFVTQYVHGGSTSVSIVGSAGEMVYHNHPSGGNFSDSDLISTSITSEAGIVASGKRGDYIFRKGTHFNSAGFVKAVRNATLRGKDYDDAAHKWLKRNQKRYGYVYSFNKA